LISSVRTAQRVRKQNSRLAIMQSEEPQELSAEPQEELLLALGQLVFAFGQLDEALHDALWMALGQGDEVRILTSGLRFPQLIERFRAIYADFRDPISGSVGG